MTKEERHQAIQEQLLKAESVSVTELAEQLDVSLVTIRKDLTEMERAGLLYRSHGKAIAINPFAANRSVNVKEKLNPEEKYAIGMEAAKFIGPDDSICLASGTTIHAFAHCIRTDHHLTVITASLQASMVLANQENIDIVQLGGTLRHSSHSVVGPFAEAFLDHCAFTKCFMGVDGIDLDFGLTTTDLREAHLNQKMMSVSQKIIVLADSSKFHRRGFAKICNMEDVDMIITDSHIKDNDRTRIEEMGIELIIAQNQGLPTGVI
ncbi:MAG: DeoR/GlpR family DNA-binding transcription regulator [Prevotella sp.]|nr:DeoR/GlpR family DNA-binding transcription regulator [Prevotella sp.]